MSNIDIIKQLAEQNGSIVRTQGKIVEEIQRIRDDLANTFRIAVINQKFITHILDQLKIPDSGRNDIIEKAENEIKITTEEIKKLKKMYDL